MRRLRLREWRERRAITQRELAIAVGMTPATINRIENGVHEARLSTVRRLAAALEIQPEDLIQWGVENTENGDEMGKAAA